MLVSSTLLGPKLTFPVKIVNIFDDRHERVINQRWNDIVEIKEEDENLYDANRRIQIMNTAFSVSFVHGLKIAVLYYILTILS